MDELMKEISEEELDEVVGGKSSKKKVKPKKLNKYCFQCQLKCNMTESLYEVENKITFCKCNCHVYKSGMYVGTDVQAVKSYCSR